MSQAVESVSEGIPTSPHKKVLVIDDNPTIVELIRHAVGMYGKYDVVVAYDGVQGLEQFYSERPDCVIVDVKMPRMDGYQVVRCIRGDSASAHTPLIILSAMIEEDDQMMGLLSGVDEYLAKPFRPSMLCAMLDKVMRITPEERERRLEQLAALQQDGGATGGAPDVLDLPSYDGPKE